MRMIEKKIEDLLMGVSLNLKEKVKFHYKEKFFINAE